MNSRLRFIYSLLGAFILFSCTDKHADSIITKAEQLLNTKPDSALAVLDDIRESKEDWGQPKRGGGNKKSSIFVL